MSGCHVVLCGWLRAQPRHVRKIASWYEDHGHSVTELLTPADGVLPSRMRHHAASALEEVHEHAGTRRPLLFHCFSGHGAILHALIVSQIHVTAPAEANAGAAQANQLYEHQRYAALGKRHIGTIYDSVPARCDAEQLVRGVGSVLGGSTAASVLLLEPLRAALLLSEWCGARWVLETSAIYRQGFDTLLAREVPQLFVHSDADDICPLTPLQGLHAELLARARGDGLCDALVQLLRFEASQHVTHWRDEHEAYAAAVERFAGEAVERDSLAWGAYKALLGSK